MKLPGRNELPGVVALVLAGGISGFVLVSALGILIHQEPLGDATTNMLSTVLGSAVGAIATFLGTTIRKKDDDL